MRPVIEEIQTGLPPEAVVERLPRTAGTVLLRSDYFQSRMARYSFVAAHPFLTFRSFGSTCLLSNASGGTEECYGNPWHLLDRLVARYELLDEVDFPFPLGGCFGYWGFDLKNSGEPKLSRRAENDLGLPDAWVGFYSTLLVFDHWLAKCWIVATGLSLDGSRSPEVARVEQERWRALLSADATPQAAISSADRTAPSGQIRSNLTRAEFTARVRRAQEYIRLGHIYQVNLSHRLEAGWPGSPWDFFLRLKERSPAPFAAYLEAGDFALASSSPELFLRLNGSHIQTRPIKGTRPRASDPTRDAQLSYELQTSPKEIAELVMITDLMRNDLGRICDFGTVHVPDFLRHERYPNVHHLVSTIEGRLRREVTHLEALRACFPGGSITGAPKFRAMQIIDELEPVSRGPYTGAIGYLGFNRESQLSIAIRTGVVIGPRVCFHVGAGIVADSSPEAEYDETIAKARGFLSVVGTETNPAEQVPGVRVQPLKTPASTAPSPGSA